MLAQHGFSAVMFVITSIADTAQVQADAGALTSSYLAWGELAAMARGGRWELQFHANQGHRLIPVAAGQTGPFYANLLYADGQRELFYLFKRRVSGDILAGRATMYAKAPGFVPVAFVVPYGEYGQSHELRADPGVGAVVDAYRPVKVPLIARTTRTCATSADVAHRGGGPRLAALRRRCATGTAHRSSVTSLGMSQRCSATTSSRISARTRRPQPASRPRCGSGEPPSRSPGSPARRASQPLTDPPPRAR